MIPDHYARYGEVTETLRAFVREYPSRCSLSSLGQTREGREIWCLTLCNPATGAPESKPALYMDGNLHSGEVASSMAVLYILDRWLAAWGKDPQLTELLDRCAVYAIPRINADAAEVYLTTPRTLRGSTEPYYPEESGIQPCDLDGDGEIRQMRIQDPAGAWKVSPRDPRIMERRGPDDRSGTFYTLVSEGVFRGKLEDLAPLRDARPREDLDPNRQFPFEWNPDYPSKDRPTSGPEPLHDVEVRVLHDFVSSRPNIVFHMNFHTFGGLHISPAVFCPHLTAPDAEAMSALGRAMRKQTGYKYEGIFPPGARDIAPGSYTTWEYFERGIMAYVTELWDFHFQADPDRPESWSMFFAESEEQFFREAETALAWDEKENGGRGFQPWHAVPCPFDAGQNPPLVEVGGWSDKFCRQNPPPHLLEGVCRKAFDAALVGLESLPDLRIQSLRWIPDAETDVEPSRRLLVTLTNVGFLPTSGTLQAHQKALGTELTLSLSGCQVLSANPLTLDKLDGFSSRSVAFRVRLAGSESLTLTVRGSRCGVISHVFSVKEVFG